MSHRHGTRIERWALRKVLECAGYPALRVVVQGGESLSPPGVDPRHTMLVKDRRALALLMLDSEAGFGEGYAAGRIQIDGDLIEFAEAMYQAARTVPRRGVMARMVSRWLEWTQRATRTGSRHNVHQHYDLRTEFYQHWLDRDLLYTCGWFPSPLSSLEEAQQVKMDRICRKLGLVAGERVAEAGCGWGALALSMAQKYGVSVRAFNLSHEQIEHARRRAQSLGLSGQVEFIEDDYRNISGNYDAFVSVGMLEHVGPQHYRDLAEVLRNCLGGSGRGLLHFIGRSRPAPLSAWIRKRIFPGAYAPSLSEALTVLEPGDFAVADVENLRQHYARTLECWLERFEAAWPEEAQMCDEEFLRAWRLYLAGSVAAFRCGELQLYQVLFAGRDCRRELWTRERAPAQTTAQAGEKPGSEAWNAAMS